MELRLTKTIILNEGDPEQKRQEILNYYHRSVEIEEKLFEPFKDDETYYLRADPLRHPLIFYFGHTAAFYINKLFLAKLIDKRINPRFESMFAVGVDEMSWDDLNQAHYDWPKPSEVAHYRLQVRELVGHFIQTHPLEMPINWHHDFWVIMMGIEHSRIHLETSSVLIRQLPLKKLNPHPFWAPCPHSHSGGPANQLLPVSGGTVTLGKNREHPLYGWDNEYGHH
ncbi:MAG: SAM-dependent methyltransferase, partial [Pseudomonadota bacterium]